MVSIYIFLKVYLEDNVNVSGLSLYDATSVFYRLLVSCKYFACAWRYPVVNWWYHVQEGTYVVRYIDFSFVG
jgi:hypothetical protein